MIPFFIVFMLIGAGGAYHYHEPEAVAAQPRAVVAPVRAVHEIVEPTHLKFDDDMLSAPIEPAPQVKPDDEQKPSPPAETPSDRVKSVEEIRRIHFYPSRYSDQAERQNERIDQE